MTTIRERLNQLRRFKENAKLVLPELIGEVFDAIDMKRYRLSQSTQMTKELGEKFGDASAEWTINKALFILKTILEEQEKGYQLIFTKPGSNDREFSFEFEYVHERWTQSSP